MDTSKGAGLSVQDPNVDINTLNPLSPEVISRQVSTKSAHNTETDL